MNERDNENDALFSIIAKHGDRFEIGEPSANGDADVLVCTLKRQGEPLIFPDNLVGHCFKCWRMVQFRPNAPKAPQRVCAECVVPLIATDPDPRFIVPPSIADDMVAYASRKVRN